MKARWAWATAVGFLAGLCLQPAGATTMTWNASSQGYWTNGTLWTGGMPGPSDTAVFTTNAGAGSANCVIDQDITVGSLLVTGTYSGTILFAQNIPGNLTINSDFYMRNGATLLCDFSSLLGQGTGRVITVGGNAVIAGFVDAWGRGFTSTTNGPGHFGYGASHAGRGYNGATLAPASSQYGSLTSPISLGSFGRWSRGGGGAVALAVTGALTVNGTISADAGQPSDITGGNSGGSVWITASTIGGNGVISANGGDDSSSGGGGGGRVAVNAPISTFAGTVSARGYTGQAVAEAGTVWWTNLFSAGSSDSPASATVKGGGQFYLYPTNYYWDLTVASTGRVVELHSGAFSIRDLLVTNAMLQFDLVTNFSLLTALSITNDINLVVGSTLVLPTNAFTNAYSCRDIFVGTSCTLDIGGGYLSASNAESGGTAANPHGVGVSINCRNATIKGTLSALARGFPGQAQSEGTSYGPGHNSYSSSHGGKTTDGNKAPYGYLARPTALGSGGRVGRGGSALKLTASGILTVDGTVTANGTSDSGGSVLSGDSGGSLWLIANSFAGTGIVTAAGAGNGATGAGAGGRISIEYGSSSFTGQTVVNGSTNYTIISDPGTIMRCQSPGGAAFANGQAGVTWRTRFKYESGSNAVLIARNVAKFSNILLDWSDSSTDTNSTILVNVETNALTGLVPSTRYLLFDGGVRINTYTTDVSGNLTFAAGLSNSVHNLRLEGPLPAGMLFMLR